MGYVDIIFKPKLVCIFTTGGNMEQVKRKEIKEEEIVCGFINTETGEIDYTLRVGDSLRLDTREQKEYRANHKVIKKSNSFVKVFKDTIGVNIGKQRFIELVGISHNTFTEGVNHLIELNIMARTKSGKNSVYLMNPFIFMNGTYINATLYRIFRKSKWNTQND